ncbi:MAG: DUF455 family protein [Myxococcota bacterium]|nr:DUF455 family protein [Myxococcota bacterium]
MEISEFAHRVLFSPDLAVKLARPARLTDRTPGRVLGAVHAPARPPGLALAPPKSRRIAFPSNAQLDAPNMRGRALHFFANHELLALELMALALLRFPDASPKFRRTLVATMRDEQKHMRLYLERMADLGVELGEIPMNNFFWSAVSRVSQPREFVARMSLTFEQANLDFALHYRDLFAEMGDLVSAGMMNEVLRDEVRHVRHGLQYFEQWRPKKTSLWDEFRGCLPFPLSAARAKGTGVFTVAHRRQAGLPDEFITALHLFRHSKGRSPTIHLFNPDADVMKRHGLHGHNDTRRALNCDLETLPLFLAAEDDIVLTQNQPSQRFLSQLCAAGLTIPQFAVVNPEKDAFSPPGDWSKRKFSGLIAWGWNAGVERFFQPLRAQFLSAGRDAFDRRYAHRRLSDKAWLADHVPQLLDAMDNAWRTERMTHVLPRSATTVGEVIHARDELFGLGYRGVVVKAAFGTAGRGAVRLLVEEKFEPRRRWIERHLERDGAVVVEPWYHRQVDLSYLFRVADNGQVKHVGLTSFLTDRSGRYRGTRLGPLGHCLPPSVKPFVYQDATRIPWLDTACAAMAEALAALMNDVEFRGLAGFDLMIVRDICGALKVRMPLELNARPTMGHIATRLKKKIAPRSIGLWWWISMKACRAAGYQDFPAVLDAMQTRLSTRRTSSGSAFEQGVIATNDPALATHIMTVLVVAPSIDELMAVRHELNLPDPLDYPVIKHVTVDA